MVTKKKKGKEVEVQEGWLGHILPFELVQERYLKPQKEALLAKENRISEIAMIYDEILSSLSEEEKDSPALNDGNDGFLATEVTKELNRIYHDVESTEINILIDYITLLDNKGSKAEKIRFIESRPAVQWQQMKANNDGTYSKAKVSSYLKELQANTKFSEGTFEAKLVAASDLMIEERALKGKVKKETEALHQLTKVTIEELSDDQAIELLELKWVVPLVSAISELPDGIINNLVTELSLLTEKYAVTYSEVVTEIAQVEHSLANMIDELVGNDFDMKGLSAFKSLLTSD